MTTRKHDATATARPPEEPSVGENPARMTRRAAVGGLLAAVGGAAWLGAQADRRTGAAEHAVGDGDRDPDLPIWLGHI